MPDALKLEELSRRTGEPVERLRDWRSRGLIGREGGLDLAWPDAERVWLIQLCLRRGISVGAIAEADRETDLIDRYVDLICPEGVAPTITFAEASERKIGRAHV